MVLSCMILLSTLAGNLVDDGLANCWIAAATIFHQEGKQTTHGFKISKIANCSSLPFIAHNTGIQQNREVGRHGVLANIQPVADLA
jgi:hypothetical protein